MDKATKKIGWGSVSLLLCIAGILFSFSFGSKGTYGDSILQFIGLKAWSKGDTGIHYTVYYSTIFFIVSFILGCKFKKDFGAKIGSIISLCIIITIAVSIFNISS